MPMTQKNERREARHMPKCHSALLTAAGLLLALPIAVIASAPNVLVVNPELPVASVAELVALAKQKPGQLQYASGGVGSFQHLGGELFKLTAGVDMLHVAFKGGGPALIDVLGGHT